MTKLRAFGYARVSTESLEQDSSFEGQQRYFEIYCQEHDLDLVRVFADRESGTGVKNRAELLNMLGLCGCVYEREHFKFERLNPQEKIIDVILVKSTSRISRNILYSIELIRILRQNNIDIIFIENGINSSDPASELQLNLLMLFDEQFSKDLSGKIKQGNIMRAKTTNTISSNGNIYGYKYIPKGHDQEARLEIIEHEAEIIRLIFSLYLEGNGVLTISHILRDKEILTRRGKYFQKNTIQQILKNEKYCGINNRLKFKGVDLFSSSKGVRKRENGEQYYKYNSEFIDPIISPETFNQAQEIMASKCGDSRGIYYGNTKYARKILCGNCGKYYHHNASNKGVGYYTCSTKRAQGKKHCSSHNIQESKLDELITVDLVNDLLARAKLMAVTKIGRTIQDLNNSIDIDNNTEIESIKSKIDDIQEKKSKLVDSFIEGIIPKDLYKDKMQLLENELSGYQEELNKLLSPIEQIQGEVKQKQLLINEIQETPPIESKDDILEMIDTIIINTDRTISISLKFRNGHYTFYNELSF